MKMNRMASLLSAFMVLSCTVFAQTKVFTEVGKGITSYMRVIVQDDQVVGYLRFTQLEKASADSFNYEIDIMDENLNDLGKVKFTDEQMQLQSVAFEKDVLCLAYLKSNVIGTEYKTQIAYKKAWATGKNAVTLQFVSLDGKILNTTSTDVSIKFRIEASNQQNYGRLSARLSRVIGYAYLTHSLQLSNIPNKGFACFYGDDSSNYLTAYSTDGKEMWRREKPGEAQGFTLHTSSDRIYLLRKTKNRAKYGGYDLFKFDQTGAEHAATAMADKSGTQLHCTTIANDAKTGKMYITGSIINPKKAYKNIRVSQLTKGYYQGLYSLSEGENDSMIFNFTSWRSGKYPEISKKGYFRSTKDYFYLNQSFKDDKSKVHFVGTSYSTKIRWGSITATVLTLPTLVVPIITIGILGLQKTIIKETRIICQDSSGKLKVVASVKGDKYGSTPPRQLAPNEPDRRIYNVTNTITNKHFVVIKDIKTITIYNVTDNNVVRTIQIYKNRYDRLTNKLAIDVLPAKEGHILVTEYDKNTKSTRYAIEAL
jgi:hypothetical protein